MIQFRKFSKAKISMFLLIAFACLIVITAFSSYYMLQIPEYETYIETLCEYRHIGQYDYEAELLPNVIYNKTVLKPNEGILYTAIVRNINLTFKYTFVSNCQINSTDVNGKVLLLIESPGKWTKKLSNAEAVSMFDLKGSVNFTMQINCTRVRTLVSDIDEETGAHSTIYNIIVKPEIRLTANMTIITTHQVKTVNETFSPEIRIAFKKDVEKGNYIDIENLQQMKSGIISESRKIWIPERRLQRTISYAIFTSAIIGFIISSFLYIKNRPQPKPSEIIKKIIAPYREMIAKTTRQPPKTRITIETENLADLIKIAKIIMKPVFYFTKNTECVFYILESDIKYQFIFKIKQEK